MASPTRIGAIINNPAVGATSIITVGAAGVAQGNTAIVIAAFFSNGSGTPTHPTDSGGNSYVLVKGPQADGGTDNGYIWISYVDRGALVNGNTIVVTSPTSSTEAMIGAYVVSGTPSGSFDVGNSGGNAASTAATSGDITTAQALETLIGIIGWQSGPTSQPSLLNGYTVLDYATPASGDGAIWGYIELSSILSSGDAIASTLSISCSWAALMIALKNNPAPQTTPGIFVESTVGQERPGPRQF